MHSSKKNTTPLQISLTHMHKISSGAHSSEIMASAHSKHHRKPSAYLSRSWSYNTELSPHVRYNGNPNLPITGARGLSLHTPCNLHPTTTTTSLASVKLRSKCKIHAAAPSRSTRSKPHACLLQKLAHNEHFWGHKTVHTEQSP